MVNIIESDSQGVMRAEVFQHFYYIGLFDLKECDPG